MIISASYRTDIPAFYGRWFERRLAAGFCAVDNPYSGRRHSISLDRDTIGGFVFWTRRLRPFLPVLAQLHADARPFVVQYTITGYPRALETAVMPWRRAVEDMHEIAGLYGRRVAVWRYDPVLLTDITPPAFHLDRFGRLAEALAGTADEVVLSFAQFYRKTARNIARAGRDHGFATRDPDDDEKRGLLSALGAIATDYGMRPTLCAQPVLLAEPLSAARCIDAERLTDVAGAPIRAAVKGNRSGCLCSQSRDIGAYDSCPHGCVYCYAVTSGKAALDRFHRHDPNCDILIPARRSDGGLAGSGS